jgi:two-component system chemotaxis response regulator CheB
LPLYDNGKLASLIRQAAQVRFPAALMAAQRAKSALPLDVPAIAIGSSTGGVEALQVLLRDFPADCPPTLIVQHVNARFAPAIAESLDEICPAQVVLAEAEMPLSRGKVSLRPAATATSRSAATAASTPSCGRAIRYPATYQASMCCFSR